MNVSQTSQQPVICQGAPPEAYSPMERPPIGTLRSEHLSEAPMQLY